MTAPLTPGRREKWETFWYVFWELAPTAVLAVVLGGFGFLIMVASQR